ncbi:MAG: hypothetical protein HQK83_19485 [Fibrobacteria bacterium]|nr:hypothetical protein [Fibrobacteria bacterium]
MDCTEAHNYFDEIITQKEGFSNSAVSAHIEACEHCQTELRNWEKITKSFNELSTPGVPEGLEDDILKAVLDSELSKDSKVDIHTRLIVGPWLKVTYALAAMLILSFGLWFVSQSQIKSVLPSEIAEKNKQDLNLVRISISLPQANSVAIAGDFNKWNKQLHQLQKGDDGNWYISLDLEKGYYQYQLVVDGQTWIPDPQCNQKVTDGFGGFNSVILI